MGKTPVIGITLDHEDKGGSYSKMPFYALRENYCTSVSRFGATPLPLPHEVEHVEAYLDMIDGLMITGGAFDVSPALYGEMTTSDTVTTKDKRTQFEFAITKGAIARKLPLLGICGGQQLLNVVLGGTLIQHIPDSIKNPLEHEQKNPRTEPGHAVEVKAGTKLSAILGMSRIEVNSAHHQAVDKVAPGCSVDALAPDGVIEGIEYAEHPFCIGVQWHPEYFVTDADDRLMAAFVEACKIR